MSDNIQVFNSMEDAVKHMQAAEKAANSQVLPLNSEIEYGSFWWRFIPEYDLFIFGEVFPEGWAITYAKEKGYYEDAEGKAEAEYEDATLRDAHERGYRYGRAYSVVEPDGEIGSTHIVEMFPMSEQDFNRAREAGWNVRADDGQLIPWFAGVYITTRDRWLTEKAASPDPVISEEVDDED